MGQKRAFVTGATGFLGGNLVRELIAQNWKVTAFHRPGSNLWRLKGLDLELREGTFFDQASLDSAMPEGVDAVFHVAAKVSFLRRDHGLMERDNVQGTKALLEAALRRKAKRFIHTSSVAVYGFSDKRVDESFPHEGLKSPMGYFKTKAQAELEVMEAVQRGLDAVILNPANIIGPLDNEHWGLSLIRVKEGKMPGAPPGAGSFAHVVEVAKAHVAAVEKGKKGENYILGGTDATYAEMFHAIEEIVGVKARIKPIPVVALKAYAWASQLGSFFTGKSPDISPDIVTLLSEKTYFDSSKAMAELGFKARPIREMLQDCWKSLVKVQFQ
jgi:dihydroflavonol-4-reductase